ncbi:MAG: hypothetical protein ACQETH_10290 [Candidatus Rifleibacteriota bacterium]
MNKNLRLKAPAIILLLGFLLTLQSAQAGAFSDIQLWFKERVEIRQHSKSITNEVKQLYSERNSIKNFAEGASTLVQSYRGITRKNAKANIPELIKIARAISQVVKGYQRLAPKAERMYKRARPSMKYFSELADETTTIQAARKRIRVKSFSNSRLNKLAGAHGWGKVFSSIKENPLNIFRWGRLRDEYKMGKVEAKLPLKCAQIAFDATAYFAAARESVNELLGIQQEIEGIMGGNLEAILNVGNTVESIKNSGNSIEAIGDLAENGTQLLNKRFIELVKVQQEYVKTTNSYNRKYKKEEQKDNSDRVATTGSSNNNYEPQASERPVNTTGGINGIESVNLQKAMEVYQEAYTNYIKISQNQNADNAEVQQAINDLRRAKQLVNQVKSQAR